MADTIIELILSGADGRPLATSVGGRMVLRPVGSDYCPVEFPIAAAQSTLRAVLPAGWVPVPAIFADVSMLGYRSFDSDLFTPALESITTIHMILPKESSLWVPSFTMLASLAKPQFQRFIDVASVSDAVDTKADSTPHKLTDWFDQMDSVADLSLAKMALLNLYVVLSSEANPISSKPWFDMVRKFVRVDRERFVAEVGKECLDHVERILRNRDHFWPIGYFDEPDPGAHAANFPIRYGIGASDICSVKRRYQRGNFQLTVAKSRSKADTYLLDCDMDEDSEIVQHGLDCLAHAFNGGTHPIDMHEYIVHDSAQLNDGPATVDLGYTLLARTF